ncbi:hypothetical protein P9720_001046 [Enterococcus faecalis]|uniref:hypothetical protein n=1 Tax=Enterococcus TaxID=1350 RepID=UPI00045A340F|nr:hypothetical protein [Enterococcus faecalis]EJR9797301.1 hypothetical protein [Enterococcus faecalis]EKR9336281.1 hypothetical protein [Enterococcus faecalis]KAJ67603.1 hypothetical protein P787_0514 [Enterococcus faecalis MN16]HBE2200053.1 hypothetical protein [Enterococcus faecalis]HBI1715518.1 hypothetical protein [Enterococcus faecalis]
MVKTTTKSYDFFKYRRIVKGDIITDLSELDKKIDEYYRYIRNNQESNVNFVKCSKNIYVGFSYIKKIEVSTGYVWVFSLSKVDIEKEAIVNSISKSVQSGRSVYAETSDEGPTTDTVILVNPITGVVIIPRNRSGIGKNLLVTFFYRITRKQGGELATIINNTDLENINHMDSIHEIDIAIHRVVDENELKDNKRSAKKEQKIIEKLEANREKIIYTGQLNIHNVVNYCKGFLNKKEDVDKLVLKGTVGDREQVIDLISNRLIYVDDKIPLNKQGKLTIENMVMSIEQAYNDNELILALDLK